MLENARGIRKIGHVKKGKTGKTGKHKRGAEIYFRGK
jgi:hypothetical protein